MRILYATPRYYPHVGGVEYVVKSVAERLAKRSHEVTVLCGEPSIDKPKEEWVSNVHVVRWPLWSPGDAYHVPRMRGKLEEWLLNIKSEYDVVHFHSVHSILPMYALEVLKNDAPHKVLTCYYHGTGHTMLRSILWKIWRFYVRRLLKFVDAIHTVSKLEAQLVERDFKIKAITIENGVDEVILKASWSPSDYVIYSGRIEKYKNIHRLANIVKLLNDKHGMNMELKIFGTGSYINHLSKRLEKLGIKYSINPPQPFEKYVENLSKALMFGLLSEKESYPQSVNEANAIGIPVVVVEPWGLNFSGRSRTLITRLQKSDEVIAQEIAVFLEESRKRPKSDVPSWDEVVDTYIKNLYTIKN